MKTNLENYEERFVDYMEGQLDASEMKEVETFVAQHPELEEDFKLFCASKLEPDNAIVFTQKEKLMKPKTVVMPLFVRIAAIAASVALLIGLGIHFFRPTKDVINQEMLAQLTPVKTTRIDVKQEVMQLKKSNSKAVTLPKIIPEQPDHKPIEPFEQIDQMVALHPIATKPLQWDYAIAEDAIASQMTKELDERLAAMEPFNNIELSDESPILNDADDKLAMLQNFLFGDARQATRNLYKQAAKTVMNAYYTIDYRIDEIKDQALASR